IVKKFQSLSCLILLVCLSCTALARSNGLRPPAPRHHRRRAAALSEFLTPPPPPLQRNRLPQFPNKSPFRQGKILNSTPSPAPESPGFFARFMGWFNPWSGGSPPPPVAPTPQLNHPGFHASVQHETYGPPQAPQIDTHGPQQQPHAPSPKAIHSQLPPLSDANCHPCDTVPWIPLINGISMNTRYAEGAPGIRLDEPHQDLSSPNYHVPAPSHEVKIPDFGWERPPAPPHNLQHQTTDTFNTDFPSPLTGPIPNPHLYPGAMPPLFKAAPWDSAPAATDHSEQLRSNAAYGFGGNPHAEVPPGPFTHQFTPPTDIAGHIPPSGPSHIGGDYVDVLPPGAETASGPEHLPPTHPEGTVNPGSFGPGVQSPAYQPAEHETASASLTPVVETHQHQNPGPSATEHHRTAVNQPTELATKVSSDGKHIIHIQQSPVIDLSEDSVDCKNSNSSRDTAEAPVILQNADGTYGINATWPSDHSGFVGSVISDRDSTGVSSTVQIAEEEHPQGQSAKVASSGEQVKVEETTTSLLVDVLRKSSGNSSEFGQRIATTPQSYENYEGVAPLGEREETSTTEEPLFEAIMKSYRNFQKEQQQQEEGRPWVDPKDIHEGAGFTASSGTARNMKDVDHQQQGGKRNKQVQIIIPYTSQYTPSPFHHGQGSWTDPGRIQPRKVPVLSVRDRSKESIEITEEERSHILQTLESLPKLKKLTRPFSSSKTNTSIDPLRLQKNIDNWTIQEYSRGATVSTAVPSPPHRLQQSKKIPDEYFTTTEPVATIKEAEKAFGNILNGFNFNDLDHEGSASSRVEVPHVRVSSSEKTETSSPKPSTESPSSSEDLSWEQLPVSISPVSKERVYIVTPQSASKPPKSKAKSTKDKSQSGATSSGQFASIERAYQVLPEAVNNLAVASTGPATLPLWGIMEHEDYAASNVSTTSPKTPILYSGHSKVSHTRQ
ncbi:uncharacterized protein LOC107039354, partial [Diachasma alloeum]|uniref:uncharacterized protein LOC107039354 n=1 Tax=Diachasma alloeum TaxID=454923 RepID=UPI0010FB4C65